MCFPYSLAYYMTFVHYLGERDRGCACDVTTHVPQFVSKKVQTYIGNISFHYGNSLLHCWMYKSLQERNQCEFLPLTKGPCQASILDCSCWRKNWTLNNYLWICSAHFVSGKNSDDPLSLGYISTQFTRTGSPAKRKA